MVNKLYLEQPFEYDQAVHFLMISVFHIENEQSSRISNVRKESSTYFRKHSHNTGIYFQLRNFQTNTTVWILQRLTFQGDSSIPRFAYATKMYDLLLLGLDIMNYCYKIGVWINDEPHW